MPDYGAQKLSKWLRPLLLGIIVFVPVPSFGSAACPEVASDAAIDAIVFRGLAHTKPAVVKRTLSLKVGEPFPARNGNETTPLSLTWTFLPASRHGSGSRETQYPRAFFHRACSTDSFPHFQVIRYQRTHAGRRRLIPQPIRDGYSSRRLWKNER